MSYTSTDGEKLFLSDALWSEAEEQLSHKFGRHVPIKVCQTANFAMIHVSCMLFCGSLLVGGWKAV